MATLFYWLIDNYGRSTTMSFFKQLTDAAYLPASTVDWALVESEFSHLVASKTHTGGEDWVPPTFAAAMDGEAAVVARVEKARAYAERLSLDVASSPQGHAFVNGKHLELDDVRYSVALIGGVLNPGPELPSSYARRGGPAAPASGGKGES